MTWDVVGFGAVAVDDLIYVNEFPLPGQKTKIINRIRQGGGLAGTALVACARLGVSTAYLGVLGYDELSSYTIDEFNKEGVDTSFVKRQDGAGPFYSIITVNKKGERNIYFYPAAVKNLSIQEIPKEIVLNSKAIFLDYSVIYIAEEIIKLAHNQAIPVIADIELIEDERIFSVIYSVDHLIINLEMGKEITQKTSPEEIIFHLQEKGTGIYIVTDGANGCWYPIEKQRIAHQPAYHVSVIDTTGCGDVFHGAYAAALTLGLNIRDSVRIASATAALKATQLGGRAGIPSMKVVTKFLKERDNGN